MVSGLKVSGWARAQKSDGDVSGRSTSLHSQFETVNKLTYKTSSKERIPRAHEETHSNTSQRTVTCLRGLPRLAQHGRIFKKAVA